MLPELAKSSHWRGSFLPPGPHTDRSGGDRPGDPGQRRGKTGDVCTGPGPSKCVCTCVCAYVHVCVVCACMLSEYVHMGAHMCAKYMCIYVPTCTCVLSECMCVGAESLYVCYVCVYMCGQICTACVYMHTRVLSICMCAHTCVLSMYMCGHMC